MATKRHGVRTPQTLQRVAAEDSRVTVRKHEYDGASVVAVDLGTHGSDPVVDVVDGTAIVIHGSGQFEFKVPEDAEEVTVHNGVLTVQTSSQ